MSEKKKIEELEAKVKTLEISAKEGEEETLKLLERNEELEAKVKTLEASIENNEEVISKSKLPGEGKKFVTALDGKRRIEVKA